MKFFFILLLSLIVVIFLNIIETNSLPPSDMIVYPQDISQGDIGLIRIKAGEGEKPRLTWLKEEVPLHPNQAMTEYFGFLSTDLTIPPGIYQAKIKASYLGEAVSLKIRVREKEYGVRTLTLPRHMVDLDSKTLERVQKEARAMKAIWEEPPSADRWRKAFIRPLEGEVIGPFGRKSVINKQPRSPHTGVDLRAKKGTPVKAINTGRVVLAADHFFSGKSVVIDHGGGIQSMYFHLDQILVKKGQTVTRGQVLGLVGSTGRATGPHLHFGVRVNGARVDPMRLIEVSRQIH